MDESPTQRSVKIERCRHGQLVRAILTHPKIFPWITDDGSPAPKTWRAPMEDYRIWLIALAPRPIGVGGFFPRSSITAETHMAFLPEAWGPLAQDAFFHMLAWIRLNSSFRRLVGEIPQSNRAAIRFAEQAGFRQYAMNEKSIVRRGRREDQVCMALDLD